MKTLKEIKKIKKFTLKTNTILDSFLQYFIFQKRIFEYNITQKVKPFPTIFQIQTINVCNGSCLMCPVSKKVNIKPKKMSNELFKKIIDEIVQNHLSYTNIYLYLQNEPLMDKDIFNKIKLIKKLSNGQITTGLVTNGSIFNDKKIIGLAESQADLIIISLDSLTEKTYNNIRQGLNFKKVMSNIDKIKKSNYKNNFAVSFVLQKENFKELKIFKKYWKAKAVPIHLSLLNNRSGDLLYYKNLALHKRKIPLSLKFRNLLDKIIIRSCHYPFINFNILCNGDVILCCNDYNHKLILGNLNHSSIKEIWNNEKFQKIRKLVFDGKLNKISTCANCNNNLKNQ